MKMVSGKVIGIVIATIVAGAFGYELTRKSSAGGPLSVGITEKIVSQGAYVGIPIPRFGLDYFQSYSVTAFAGSTIQFTATVAGGVSPYTYAWTFGDGGTGSGNPVSHTFTTGGSFTVTVTVTDTIGNTASGTDTVTITAQLATALALNTPPYAQTNTTVNVVAKLSDSAGPIAGELVTFNYVFTNGTTGVQTATTDSTGTATTSVLSSSITGTMTVYAAFAGDTTKGLDAATSATQSTIVYAPLTVTGVSP